MFEESPNSEEIDELSERLRDIYDYDELKDCDVDYLHNREAGVMNLLKQFEATYPAENSVMSEDLRAAVYDDPNENKAPLTSEERVRLRLLRREISKEIHRAKGHRIELRREHRSKIFNSASDMVSAFLRVFNSLLGKLPG